MLTASKLIAITSLLFLIFFSSCSNTSENNLAKFRALNEGLEKSNSIIHNQTTSHYKILEERLQDPATVDRTSIWHPKAMLIQKLSHEMINYIEGLKLLLQNSDDDNTNSIQNLFIKQKKGEELYQKLTDYNKSVMQVDAEIYSIFNNKLLITTSASDSNKINSKDFAKTFFGKAFKTEAMALLSKFENNIYISENELVTFCYHKTSSHTDPYTSFSAPR